MSPDPEPHARLPKPAQADASAVRAGAPDQEAGPREAGARRLDRRRASAALKLRFVLLCLSAGGLCGAALLWANGHDTLAARLLAGDVMVIFLLLLTV